MTHTADMKRRAAWKAAALVIGVFLWISLYGVAAALQSVPVFIMWLAFTTVGAGYGIVRFMYPIFLNRELKQQQSDEMERTREFIRVGMADKAEIQRAEDELTRDQDEMARDQAREQ